jgi:hypothetical protein
MAEPSPPPLVLLGALMATEQDLRDRVLHLLRSPAATKIVFTLDGVTIAGMSLHLVAMAVVTKQLGAKGIGLRTGHVAADADAGYDPAADVFDFPDYNYGTTEFQRQAIIHEAIHAYLDMIKSGKTALTDEALAYVGGLLFHIHDKTAAGATPTAPSFATTPGVSFTEAFRIAKGLFTSGSTAVSAADATSMRDTIANRPAYASLKAAPTTTYGNNGVW